MSTQTATTTGTNGSPIVAAILSLIIPGLGHYYAGKKSRGIYWFAAVAIYVFISLVLVLVGVGLLMLLIEPVFHLGAAVDAYIQSNK